MTRQMQAKAVLAQAPEEDEQPSLDRKLSLVERVPEQPQQDDATADRERQPGDRRAARDAKKAEKAQKQAEEAAGTPVYPGATAADGSPLTTVNSEPLKLALSQQLQGPRSRGNTGSFSENPPVQDQALMMYLGMQMQAPHMLPGGGGAIQHDPTTATTVMLRNIPNRYTREKLVERLDQGFKKDYDFVYLPTDFNSECNVGYAFINFRAPATCQRFMQEFNGVKTKDCLPGFGSSKVCEVTYARVQGRDANMGNLRDVKFIEKLTEHPEWQPLYLDDNDGQIPFTSTLTKEAGGRRSRLASRADSIKSPSASPGMTPMNAPPPPPMMMPPFGMSPFGMSPYASMSPYGMMAPNFLPPGVGVGTTVMLRNIPNKYTRTLLIDRLKRKFKGFFDFLYLPPNAQNTGNVGYAFINFRTPQHAAMFSASFHGVKASICLPGFYSNKVCEVSQARVQSLSQNMANFREKFAARNPDSQPDEEWFPICFDHKGNPLPVESITASAGQMSAGAQPFLPTQYPAVPAKALDSRALEKKMEAEATGHPQEKRSSGDYLMKRYSGETPTIGKPATTFDMVFATAPPNGFAASYEKTPQKNFVFLIPGDEELFLGGGALNGAVGKVLLEHGKQPIAFERDMDGKYVTVKEKERDVPKFDKAGCVYRRVHKALFPKARASRNTVIFGTSEDIAANSALSFSCARTYSDCDKAFGAAFLDVFKKDNRPHSNKNIGCVYTVGVLGKNAKAEGEGEVEAERAKYIKTDVHDFLNELYNIGENCTQIVLDYNATQDHSKDAAPAVEVIRFPIVSGGVFIHPEVTPREAALALIWGIHSSMGNASQATRIDVELMPGKDMQAAYDMYRQGALPSDWNTPEKKNIFQLIPPLVIPEGMPVLTVLPELIRKSSGGMTPGGGKRASGSNRNSRQGGRTTSSFGMQAGSPTHAANQAAAAATAAQMAQTHAAAAQLAAAQRNTTAAQQHASLASAAYQQAAHAAAQAQMAASASMYGAAYQGGYPRRSKGQGKGQDSAEIQRKAMRLQIEFYFSIDNLCKDTFLRSHMNESSWVSLDIISQFPKVKRFGANLTDIAVALNESTLVEVDPSKKLARLRDENTRAKFPKMPDEYRSLGSLNAS